MTETDNNSFPGQDEELFESGAAPGEQAAPDPDVTAYSKWTYTDMQREFADITRRIVMTCGIDQQIAVMYAYNLLDIIDPAGYEKELFSEYFMARTVYFKYVLSNDIKLPPSPDARTLFNDYAALTEAWGDRHYKGLELSKEDTDRLRADSYAVLSGLTKRAVEDESEVWRPSLTPRLAPLEAMKLVEVIAAETERLKAKYLPDNI